MESFFGFISVLPGAFRWGPPRAPAAQFLTHRHARSRTTARTGGRRSMGRRLAGTLPSSPPRPWRGARSNATSIWPRTGCCVPKSLRAKTASTFFATSRMPRVRWASGGRRCTAAPARRLKGPRCQPTAAETDVPNNIAALMNQRRRWSNGAFFASIYALQNFARVWREARHTLLRRILLTIQFTFYAFTCAPNLSPPHPPHKCPRIAAAVAPAVARDHSNRIRPLTRCSWSHAASCSAFAPSACTLCLSRSWPAGRWGREGGLCRTALVIHAPSHQVPHQRRARHTAARPLPSQAARS